LNAELTRMAGAQQWKERRQDHPELALYVREVMRTLLDAISVLPFEREDARVAAQLRASLNNQGMP
jgi:predicted nucleic acid-binding protein